MKSEDDFTCATNLSQFFPLKTSRFTENCEGVKTQEVGGLNWVLQAKAFSKTKTPLTS
jgi:hypothetical protein